MVKRFKYLGEEYEVDQWGGSHKVAQQPNIVTPDRPEVKRTRPVQPNQPNKRFKNDANMAEAMDTDDAMVASANAGTSNASGTKKGAHETQIISQQPTYGLPEVTTVIFPWTTYFSIGLGISPQTFAEDFYLRMGSLYDLFPNTIATQPTGGAAIVQGLYNTMAGGATTWPNPLVPYPTTPVVGTVTTETPQWRAFYAKLYQFYSVLKTEWEVTFHNPRNGVNADVLIAHAEEAHKAGETTGNIVPTGQYSYIAENWPGLKWHVLHSQGDQGEDMNWLQVKGTYYPNQAKKNVRNDEDVKTWTAMGAQPSLEERIHFKVWKAAFNDQGPQAINVRVHLRIIAQLRDLETQARYPQSGGTAIALDIPVDVLRTGG